MEKLFLSFISIGIFICHTVFAQRDIRNIDNISCIGNGRMAVYEAKADILQIFGPPYSSPSVLDMIMDDTTIQVHSQREKGTAIWIHELWRNDSLIGSVVDLMDSASPVLIRKFVLNSPVRFSIHFADKIRIIPNTDSYAAFHVTGALLAESPRGVPYYNDYPMPFKQFLQLAGKKNLKIVSDSAAGKYSIDADPGEGYLYLIGGPLYPDCISHTQSALSVSYKSISQGTWDCWKRFTSRRRDFEKLMPAETPDREKLMFAIDAVAVNCKTQQSIEGGVLAGHNYHLGYVRDQYGVSRGLLRMGYFTEAKGILDFFWQTWKKKEVIHNAQGIGIDIFHIHENDEVEITGYLIIQAFDYLEKSGDQAFVKEIFPMLEWAFKSEKRNLAKSMLPFNGDETYIAGGILPRSCIVDGSAEATLLFITGANKLIDFAEKKRLWPPSVISQNRKLVKETAGHYRENFFIKGQLYCNNMSRSEGLILPAFRHGVCEGLGQGCEFYGWTQKNENNRYLCPVCFTKINLPKKLPVVYLIRSVSMMPQFMGSTLFSKKEIKELLKPTIDDFKQTGRLPSRPDGNVTVGYDYGLLLYNLTLLHDPLNREIYEKMMSKLDETGSWVEYYENGKATGTRYRPWESGINIEAAIDYAQSLNKNDR
jgi:hypothetical protein